MLRLQPAHRQRKLWGAEASAFLDPPCGTLRHPAAPSAAQVRDKAGQAGQAGPPWPISFPKASRTASRFLLSHRRRKFVHLSMFIPDHAAYPLFMI